MKLQAAEISQKVYELVTFIVGSEEYAADISYIKEIIRLPHITAVPNSPDFIEGVINLRGRIIPVIDLKFKMGMEKKEGSGSSRIIVVEIDSKIVGFIVDSVKEVIRITDDIIEEPPNMIKNSRTQYIYAVAKFEDRLIILVDLKKILTESEDGQLASVV